jgi:hypothetical protein
VDADLLAAINTIVVLHGQPLLILLC